MTISDIEKKLRDEIAAIIGINAESITPGALLHTLGVDSMSFVELLVFIEKEFKIKLIESGIAKEDFRTIRSLAKCINKART